MLHDTGIIANRENHQMAEYHELDRNPFPRNKAPLFVNEPWLVDRSCEWIEELLSAPYFVIIAMSF